MSVDVVPPAESASGIPVRRGARPGLATCVIAVTLALWLVWVVGTALASGGRYDFTTYYVAATALRLDPHANIYSGAVLIHAASVAGGLPYHPLAYTYPPLLAILLVPLSLLPFAAAAVCWYVLNAALWLGCAFLLAGEVRSMLAHGMEGTPPRELSALALAATLPLCLLSWPAASSLLLGQLGVLVLAPLALVPRLLRQGRDGWAGAAIATAAMLKFTPLLLLGYLVLTRRWRALRSASLALAALASFCVVIVGPGVDLQAVPQALRIGSDDAARANNQALFGVVAVALHASAPSLDTILRLLEYAVLLGIAAATALLLARHAGRTPTSSAPTLARHWDEQDAAAYALALCALLLVAPVAWSHHYTWLLPANALVLGNALRRWRGASQQGKREAAARQLSVVVLATLLINLAAADPLQQALARFPPVILGFSLGVWANELPALGALLLFGIAARQVRQSPSNTYRSKPVNQTATP